MIGKMKWLGGLLVLLPTLLVILSFIYPYADPKDGFIAGVALLLWLPLTAVCLAVVGAFHFLGKHSNSSSAPTAQPLSSVSAYDIRSFPSTYSYTKGFTYLSIGLACLIPLFFFREYEFISVLLLMVPVLFFTILGIGLILKTSFEKHSGFIATITPWKVIKFLIIAVPLIYVLFLVVAFGFQIFESVTHYGN